VRNVGALLAAGEADAGPLRRCSRKTACRASRPSSSPPSA